VGNKGRLFDSSDCNMQTTLAGSVGLVSTRLRCGGRGSGATRARVAPYAPACVALGRHGIAGDATRRRMSVVPRQQLQQHCPLSSSVVRWCKLKPELQAPSFSSLLPSPPLLPSLPLSSPFPSVSRLSSSPLPLPFPPPPLLKLLPT